jgi:hypothetical protein
VTKRASMRPRVADPVVTEIVRRGVMAVTEDMKTNSCARPSNFCQSFEIIGVLRRIMDQPKLSQLTA